MFLATHGKGGYTFLIAYCLPVRVRKLAVRNLQELLEAEANAMKKSGEAPEKPSITRGPAISRNPSSKSTINPKINKNRKK